LSSIENDGFRSIFVQDRLTFLVSVSLVATASLAWIASFYLMPLMMMSGGMGVAAIVSSSSLSLSSIGLFEVVWVTGMTAMMFPAMIPVVLLYEKIATKLEDNPKTARVVGTPLFLGGYLASYTFLGLGAYLAVYAALRATSAFTSLAIVAVVAPSAVLVMTGLYQFSRLKSRCLSKCISPLGFFATHSKKGLFGSLQMGFTNGAFCVGCCWAFMIVMLAVGLMSIPVMAILSGVIAVEKIVARGSIWFNRVVGMGFIALGAAILFFPSLLVAI
jgi:predicted metal-binding membrane protein